MKGKNKSRGTASANRRRAALAPPNEGPRPSFMFRLFSIGLNDVLAPGDNAGAA
jgi:hypothetical protein